MFNPALNKVLIKYLLECMEVKHFVTSVDHITGFNGKAISPNASILINFNSLLISWASSFVISRNC